MSARQSRLTRPAQGRIQEVFLIRAPNRLQLSVIAAIAAGLAALLMHQDWNISAAVAAVIAVGCIAEAWRRDR